MDGYINGLNPDALLVQNTKMMGTLFEPELLLLNEVKTHFALKSATRDLWSLLASAKSPKESVDVILKQYDISGEQAESKCYAIITELLNDGLICPCETRVDTNSSFRHDEQAIFPRKPWVDADNIIVKCTMEEFFESGVGTPSDGLADHS